jgi:sulfur carrier protein ThiS
MMASLRSPNEGGDARGRGVARLVLRNREFEVRPGITILYALIKLGIDVQVVRPMRDGQLIDLETVLEEGDLIQLVPLIAGGV